MQNLNTQKDSHIAQANQAKTQKQNAMQKAQAATANARQAETERSQAQQQLAKNSQIAAASADKARKLVGTDLNNGEETRQIGSDGNAQTASADGKNANTQGANSDNTNAENPFELSKAMGGNKMGRKGKKPEEQKDKKKDGTKEASKEDKAKMNSAGLGTEKKIKPEKATL